MKYLPHLFLTVVISFQTVVADVFSREIIGEVLEKTIYRDQLNDIEGDDLHAELHTLFAQPLLEEYSKKHKKEMEPSSSEIAKFVAFYKKQHEENLKDRKQIMLKKIAKLMGQLKNKDLTQSEKDVLIGEIFYLRSELDPPGLEYAKFVLPYWKMQKHFYKKFGGGRVLWQQRGIEAFDAYHRWLKKQEKKGLFSITNKQLRESFYHYWTTMDHGSFLISDKFRIKKEFLKPEWLSIGIVDKKGCFYFKKKKSSPVCKIYKREY